MANIDGTAANDTLHGTPDEDRIDGKGGDDQLFGLGADDHLLGGDGRDLLDGGVGADLMNGGFGNDIYVVEDEDDLVVEDTPWFETIRTSLAEYRLPAFFDVLIGTSDAGQILIGNSEANSFYGGSGRDVFRGGSGSDVYYVDENDVVRESEAPNDTSADVVRTDVQEYVLAENVERLGNINDSDEDWLGNAKNNHIFTGAGDDIIDGGAGADFMDGGAGDDTYYFDRPGDEAREHDGGGFDTVYTSADAHLTPNIERLIALGGTGAVTLEGSSNGNVIAGAGGDDLILGGGGNDTLSGEAGVDHLRGGAHNDILFGGDGDDWLEGHDDHDSLSGGAGLDLLEGQAGDDALNGGSARDVLEGGAGDDLVNGASGVDTASYMDARGGVVVSLEMDGAQDTGHGVDTLIHIENIAGSRFDDLLRGDDRNNTLTGGAGADLLRGNGGNDRLFGEIGSDTATYAGAGAAVLVDLDIRAGQNTGGAGIDTLRSIENVTGSGFADTLGGSRFANRLSGGDGNDRLDGDGGDDDLIGGSGRDLMAGGAGADSFRFDDGDGSTLRRRADVIEDFSRSEGDLIDLRQIDADASTAAGDDAFTFIGSAAFSGDAGELRASMIGGETFVQGDTDGDGAANFFIRVDGVQVLQATDFVL